MKFKKIISMITVLACMMTAPASAIRASAAVKGDVSGNGKADLQDAITIAKSLLGTVKLTSAQKTAADYNGDGTVDLHDAIGIAAYLAKKNQSLPTNSNADKILKLVNAERAKKGVAPLKLNKTLSDAAGKRAVEISKLFDHARPDGTMCFTVLDEYNISFWAAGENIAAGYSTPEDTMNQWVNSPGHYANIINSDFNELGVGYYSLPGSEYRYYWVQLFIKN